MLVVWIRQENWWKKIPEKAEKLAQLFWPAPLTLLLKRKSIIPDLITSGMDTVGIRCPYYPLTQSLLQTLEFPLEHQVQIRLVM